MQRNHRPLNRNRGPTTRPWGDLSQKSNSNEESADTYHDHIHRGQDKSENGPQLALESVSRGAWHCVAQHFQNAAQRSAKLPGGPNLRPDGGQFTFQQKLLITKPYKFIGFGGGTPAKPYKFILASVYMVMVCVSALSSCR